MDLETSVLSRVRAGAPTLVIGVSSALPDGVTASRVACEDPAATHGPLARAAARIADVLDAAIVVAPKLDASADARAGAEAEAEAEDAARAEDDPRMGSPVGLEPEVLRVLRASAIVGRTSDVETVAKVLDTRPEDVVECLQLARDLGAPLTDRGAGPLSMPGEVATALVVDVVATVAGIAYDLGEVAVLKRAEDILVDAVRALLEAGAARLLLHGAGEVPAALERARAHFTAALRVEDAAADLTGLARTRAHLPTATRGPETRFASTEGS